MTIGNSSKDNNKEDFNEVSQKMLNIFHEASTLLLLIVTDFLSSYCVLFQIKIKPTLLQLYFQRASIINKLRSAFIFQSLYTAMY